MELFIDKETLGRLTSNLEQEINNYKKYIYTFYKELDSLYQFWDGDQYQLFMKEVEKNRKEIENSGQVLSEYYNLINDSLNNYTRLSEGVHYNE